MLSEDTLERALSTMVPERIRRSVSDLAKPVDLSVKLSVHSIRCKCSSHTLFLTYLCPANPLSALVSTDRKGGVNGTHLKRSRTTINNPT